MKVGDLVTVPFIEGVFTIVKIEGKGATIENDTHSIFTNIDYLRTF